VASVRVVRMMRLLAVVSAGDWRHGGFFCGLIGFRGVQVKTDKKRSASPLYQEFVAAPSESGRFYGKSLENRHATPSFREGILRNCFSSMNG